MQERWQLRPGRWEDLPRMVEILGAQDLRYRGWSGIDLKQTRERLAADPDADLAADSVLAWCGDRAVGVAVVNPRALNLATDPDHDAPGLREALLDWGDGELARRNRPSTVAIPVAVTPWVELLRARGYTFERAYSEMTREFTRTGPPEPAQVPAGYRLDPVDPAADGPVLHALDAAAFGPAPDYLPETTDEFIALLAVDPGHAGRGLGRALLLSAFAGIHDAGLDRAVLHVASDNPRALSLYTGVGMTEGDRIEHLRRPSSAG